MNRQQEGVSTQTMSDPEGRRAAPRRRQCLRLIAVALVGVVVGALGLYAMRYVGMILPEATQDADERPGSQRDTRTRAASGARLDEARRGEGAGVDHDAKKLVHL